MAEQFTGKVEIRNSQGDVVFVLDAEGRRLHVAADVELQKGEDSELFNRGGLLFLGGGDADGQLIVRSGNDKLIRLTNGNITAGGFGRDGTLTLRDGEHGKLVELDTAGNGELHLNSASQQAELDVDGTLFARDGRLLLRANAPRQAQLVLRDEQGNDAIWMGAEHALLHVGTEGNEGDVRVLDGKGEVRVHLDGASGDVKLHGADCAEWFEVADDGPATEPGTLMIVDDSGLLRSSEDAYDHRVAGVVAGAGDLHPGVLLGDRPGHRSSNRVPLSVAGSTYCRAEARSGPIRAGDLLTTSATPGHARCADDRQRAFGAVVGKALQPLRDGQGLVPIVVSLQ
jgi:hypothetical protein